MAIQSQGRGGIRGCRVRESIGGFIRFAAGNGLWETFSFSVEMQRKSVDFL